MNTVMRIAFFMMRALYPALAADRHQRHHID